MLWLLAAFLVLSAFFSGSEAALLSVQRVRLRHLVNTKTAGASRVARMVEHPEKLLPPILLGNNLVNTRGRSRCDEPRPHADHGRERRACGCHGRR